MLTSARSRLSAAVRAAVEQLEERTFLSVQIQGNGIYVTGDTTRDQIIVQLAPGDPSTLEIIEQSSSDPTVGQVTALPLDGIGGTPFNFITIDTGTGDHLVQINEAYGRIFLSADITGGDGNDTLIGGSGNNFIDGGLGDDSIVGGSGSHNYLLGGDGNDTIVGGTGNVSYIWGQAGDDSIMGGKGNDYIDAGDGNDTIVGGIGNDYIWGGNGDDSITCGVGNDTVDGGATGNDTIVGNTGNNIMVGSRTGNNEIDAGAGNDTMFGGLGNDTLRGGTNPDGVNAFAAGGGSDMIFPSPGWDTYQLDGEPASIVQPGGDPTKQLFANIRILPQWWQNPTATNTGINDVLISPYGAAKAQNPALNPLRPSTNETPAPTSHVTHPVAPAIATGKISGVKFNDLNGDGVREANEPGLKGWQVYVDLNNNGKWDKGEPLTTTTASGSYSFAGLTPGNYVVRDLNPSGWATTSAPTAGRKVALALGQTLASKNSGSVQPASISGWVFYDKNANGKTDAGELGFPGKLAAFLDYNNNGVRDANEPAVAVAANGMFSFPAVLPNTWYVRIAGASSAWYWTAPASGVYKITLAAGQHLGGVAFGLCTYAAVTGTVFKDLNGNGIQDAGESGKVGWRVYVDSNNNGVWDAGEKSVLTDANGKYVLAGLKPGAYVIRVAPPPGHAPVTTSAFSQTLQALKIYNFNCGVTA